ncbi:MAG: cation transporter [Peptococcaceae bacterium]|nr:cation transporter [Peptococcaceae bacterium]
MEKTMIISGMTCPHCYLRVEHALNNLNGVQARVNAAAKSAVVYCDDSVDEVTLIRAVQKAGYQVVSVK